jgi:hypothetical protein
MWFVSGRRELAGPAVEQPVRVRSQALANASCSAAACHGAPATSSLMGSPGDDCWKSSATQWLARDPHTEAYNALTGPWADRILRHLRSTEPDRWAAQPTDEPRCLACHTNPTLAALDAPQRARLQRLLAEGVSCEACHGNASGWVYEHTTWTAENRPTGYARFGMKKLYDVGERALVCAGCHVGAPADPDRGEPLRDMNHDMIAAGHPRLNFEYADFLRRVRPHWVEKDRTRESSPPLAAETEVKGWLLGRVASAEAACRLLADRAERAVRDEASSWPELSESNCFSCHHRVLPTGWKKPRPEAGREPGAPVWQPIWPLTQPLHLAALGRSRPLTPLVARTQEELNALREVLEVAGVPRPGAARERASATADTLLNLRTALQSLPERSVAQTCLDLYDAIAEPPFDWDDACQVVHGLAALERMRLRLAPPDRQSTNPRFNPVFERLKLRRSSQGIGYNSPRGYDPDVLRREFGDLLSEVRRETRAVVK